MIQEEHTTITVITKKTKRIIEAEDVTMSVMIKTKKRSQEKKEERW